MILSRQCCLTVGSAVLLLGLICKDEYLGLYKQKYLQHSKMWQQFLPLLQSAWKMRVHIMWYNA